MTDGRFGHRRALWLNGFWWRDATLFCRSLVTALLLTSLLNGWAQASEPVTDCNQPFPLSTQGRYIVDACGDRFKLRSVNWFGASDVTEVPGGLEFRPLPELVALIRELGFNSVRLPFSNQMLHNVLPVDAFSVAANPALMGKTPLQVFDAVVDALTDAGLAVILNNHTTLSEWCCGYDFNGLWYHAGSPGGFGQTTEQWQQDWLMLLARYQHNPAVVGADLRNEVRTGRWGTSFLPISPNWGWGNQNDWHRIAQQTGNLILHDFPDLLIVVEGINWWGVVPLLGSGARPHLMPVRERPVVLQRPNKLVYAAHNYGFTGPHHNGDDRTSPGQLRYRDYDEAALRDLLDKEWGFVLDDEQPYTAPVWVSEFGVAHQEEDPAYRQWFSFLIRYMRDRDLDFAYWPLNPTRVDGTPDYYGLLDDQWQAARQDWRWPLLNELLADTGRSGPIPPVTEQWSIVNFKHQDDVQRGLEADWAPGAHKGHCPPGQRLLGLTRGGLLSGEFRGLCGNPGAMRLDDAETAWRRVAREPVTLPSGSDWAPGYTKLECPRGFAVTGVAKRWWGYSDVLCAPQTAAPTDPAGAAACQVLWLNPDAPNRLSERGGDWAGRHAAGQCADHQHLRGLAHRAGVASAVLCCQE